MKMFKLKSVFRPSAASDKRSSTSSSSVGAGKSGANLPASFSSKTNTSHASSSSTSHSSSGVMSFLFSRQHSRHDERRPRRSKTSKRHKASKKRKGAETTLHVAAASTAASTESKADEEGDGGKGAHVREGKGGLGEREPARDQDDDDGVLSDNSSTSSCYVDAVAENTQSKFKIHKSVMLTPVLSPTHIAPPPKIERVSEATRTNAPPAIDRSLPSLGGDGNDGYGTPLPALGGDSPPSPSSPSWLRPRAPLPFLTPSKPGGSGAKEWRGKVRRQSFELAKECVGAMGSATKKSSNQQEVAGFVRSPRLGLKPTTRADEGSAAPVHRVKNPFDDFVDPAGKQQEGGAIETKLSFCQSLLRERKGLKESKVVSDPEHHHM